MSSRSCSQVPPYFDYLIEAFHRGDAGRFVHLGHWDLPPEPDEPVAPADFLRAQERLDDILLRMAAVGDGDVVVDVACGFGGTVEGLDRNHSRLSLLGVNVDPRQLAICRDIVAGGGNRLAWQLADACALALRDGSVDRLLCIEAMFHFRSRRRFFAEAARVLRPGGALVFSDIVLTPPPAGLTAPAFALQPALQTGFGPWPDPWGEDADHAELGRIAGLECVELRDASAETSPSHRFTVASDADIRRDPGDPARRATLALAWLHRNGLLRYLYGHFRKA